MMATGYTPDQVSVLRTLLAERPGICLVASPADALGDRHRASLGEELRAEGRLVTSLEHGIQYRNEHLVQLEIGREGGAEFPALWQAALAMGPDVVLIDDVRDAAEARALLEAVASGATAVAQVRAFSSREALFQLFRFEIDRHGLARALLGAVERVSLRRPCPHCRIARTPTAEEADLFGLLPGAQVSSRKGCPVCGDGFLGRRVIFGLLQADEELAAIIRSAEPQSTAWGTWDRRMSESLWGAAREALLSGDATPEETKVLHPSTATS